MLLLAFILVVSFSVYFFIKLATFSSDRTWTNLTSNNAPYLVVDTITKQLLKNRMDFVTLLDSSYYGKVSVAITNNHYLLFSYDYYTIHYKNQSVTIKKENYHPPYVIYQNKLYCSVTRELSSDSSLLQMKFISLN